MVICDSVTMGWYEMDAIATMGRDGEKLNSVVLLGGVYTITFVYFS